MVYILIFVLLPIICLEHTPQSALPLTDSHDQFITDNIRGFPGDSFFAQIRQRPSVPLLALLWRRLSCYDEAYVNARK